MKVLLCSIVKGQNKYLREWVEHYYNLGVSNIYLYDNNEIDGENLTDVIGDYIDSGYVVVDNSIKGKPLVDKLQCSMYNKCYKEQSKNYNWIAFYDTDEYLTLTAEKSVNQWLLQPRYKNFDVIAIHWKTFTDNDIFYEKDSTSIDQYTSYVKNARSKDSIRTKCIYKTKLKGLFGKICIHGNLAQIKMCGPDGKARLNTKYPYTIQNLKFAYLKHLKYRSVESVCNKVKMFLKQNKSHARQILQEYLQNNKKTSDKLQYIKQQFQGSNIGIETILPK